jgi:hypothetical protein
MAFKLKVVDWRDGFGFSHPEYAQTASLWNYVEGPRDYETRAEAEKAAEAAWIEPDCNGVAPVCVVTES